MNTTISKLDHASAAQKLASMLIIGGKKARVWTKKEGETRIYTQHGYLLISSECELGYKYFTKSYEISELKPIVEEWKTLVQVVSDRQSLTKQILMQEDEDGLIAPEGQHEQGVYIVREWLQDA